MPDKVLKNNYESLVYCNNMLKAMENIKIRKDAAAEFHENLENQQLNITEVGEKEATDELTKNFGELLADPADSTNYPEIRESIYQIINELNQNGDSTEKVILLHNKPPKRQNAGSLFYLLYSR